MSVSPVSSEVAPPGGLGRVLFDNAEELVGFVLLSAIGIMMMAQVVLRTLFGAPLSWPEELSQFLFAWCSTLGAVGAYKRRGLVILDLVTRRLPGGWQAALQYLCALLIAAVLVVVGWKGYQLAARTSFSAATLPVTWAWAYAAAPAFAVLMLLRMIQMQGLKYRYLFVERWLGLSQSAEGGGATQ